MGDLENIVESQKQEERNRKELYKSYIMSYSNHVKPFFVELQFTEQDFFYRWKKMAHGMINGSLIKSFQPINPKRLDDGTQINYVFGEIQYVAESVEEVTRIINDVIQKSYS